MGGQGWSCSLGLFQGGVKHRDELWGGDLVTGLSCCFQGIPEAPGMVGMAIPRDRDSLENVSAKRGHVAWWDSCKCSNPLNPPGHGVSALRSGKSAGCRSLFSMGNLGFFHL